MNGRGTIVGLCMLCALLVSAFAAQSASAITGTTAFTCSKGAVTKDRVGEHCLNAEGPKEYGHVAIAQGTTTEVTTTNAKTNNSTAEASTARLKVTIAGVALELGATTASGSGWMTNGLAPNGEHYAHGEGTTTFTGVQVTQPAGRGCKVFTDNEATKTKGEEGAIHTRLLKVTSQEQGDFVKMQPKEGESFANFFVECEEGKKIPAIEGTWECGGSVKGIMNGVTVEYSHTDTTTQNTFKCRGAKAGIDLKTTVSGRAGAGAYTPLSMTTVAT